MKTDSGAEHARLLRYLLCELPEAERESVAERCLFDERYAQVLDELETALVDAYVEGTLTAEQRRDFVNCFLVTENRKQAVQAAYLAKAYRERLASPFLAATPRTMPPPRVVRSHVMAVLAAALAIVVAGVWIVLRQLPVQQDVKIVARAATPAHDLSKPLAETPVQPPPASKSTVRRAPPKRESDESPPTGNVASISAGLQAANAAMKTQEGGGLKLPLLDEQAATPGPPVIGDQAVITPPPAS